jgi:hypothetical protein
VRNVCDDCGGRNDRAPPHGPGDRCPRCGQHYPWRVNDHYRTRCSACQRKRTLELRRVAQRARRAKQKAARRGKQ